MGYYYVESGKVNWGLTLLAIIPALIGVGILGYSYAFLTEINPFIYINFIGTILYVIVVGACLKIVKKWGRIRNSTVLYAVGAIVAIFGLYVVWIAFMSSSLDRPIDYFAGHFFKGLDVMSYRVISIGRYNSGFEISGAFLYFLWIIEALILTVGPLVLVHSGLKEASVYCENCDKWMDNEELHLKETSQNLSQTMLEDAINQNKLQPILDLENAVAGIGSYYELKITSCSTCNSPNYLSAKLITHTRNNKDKLERNERLILPYYTKGGY